jgi:hypothetical protein
MSALRKLAAAVAVLVVLTVPACEAASDGPDGPEELGVVAARIHVEPDRASEILAEHGFTREEFGDRVWEISEDPDAARRYTEAMEQEMESGSGASPR